MFGPQVRVSAQGSPAVMQRELLHLDDGVTGFEQPARGFMPEVVKAQVVDIKKFARLTKGAAN